MIEPIVENVDCMVIGGGPAGAACAIALKNLERRNASKTGARRVILVERDAFPRFKVCGCCFNGAGASMLQALGCYDILDQCGAIPLTRWQAQFLGSSAKADLPKGWALSRNSLDKAMLDYAHSVGVEVLQPAVAKITDLTETGAGVEVADMSGRKSIYNAAVAIAASGLAGLSLEKWLPWTQMPGGPVGAGAAFPTASRDYEPGVIYMACSRYGYAGIVRLENGWIDVAAALYDPAGMQRGLSIENRIASILADAQMPQIPELGSTATKPLRSESNAGIISWKGTPHLHRQRVVGNQALMAVGDAAGYVEPFTGEGMAWALRTGSLAAECIYERMWLERSPAGAACELYKQRYTQTFSKRRLPCKMLARSLQYKLGRKMIFTSLSMFPWLARPFIRTINAA